MSPRRFGFFAALVTLLIGVPAGQPIDARIASVVAAAAADVVCVEALPRGDLPQAVLWQRIDGDDAPDPAIPAGAVVGRSEPVADRGVRLPVDPVHRPAVRAASARGPPLSD
jgi:hypothetical protein